MLLKKLVFFGGKGGVGKSTLSCATALRLSEKDKTFLLSIDPAHSLSGILGVYVGPKVKEIKENLFAVEIKAEELVEEYASKVLFSLADILPAVRSGIKNYVKYLKSSPTALETAVLDKLLDYCLDFPYIIVDSAPTGQMLRLFETAHMVEDWFNFLSRIALERQKIESFMGRKDNILSIVEARRGKLKKLINLFMEKTIVFAVANEEPLSLSEAEEIKKRLKHVKVYTIINRWESMDCQCIKVPRVEAPYGLEKLTTLRVEAILELILKPLS